MYFEANDTLRLTLVKVKHKLSKEEKRDIVCEIKCYVSNTIYMGETYRQLNVWLKNHKQCLKNVPESSVNLKKLENKLATELNSLETS